MNIYNVPLVSATEATLDNFNNPLRYIQKALNALEQQTSLLYNKSAIIIYDQPVAVAARLGDLVYYETSTGQFTPAQALLQAQPGRQGESVQAACARVIGIIIAVSGATATILCGGIYKDGAVADACLGPNAEPGTYYLSPAVAGKAVLDPGQELRQPVLQYMGDGKFSLSCFYLAHDGHQHATVRLVSSHWIQDTDADGAQLNSYTYNSAEDPDMLALGQISTQTTALFVGGILQTWGQKYSISEDGKLCSNQAPGQLTHTLMNHYPLAYGAPIVRDIVSDTAILETRRRGGIVHLELQPYTQLSTQQLSGTAIQHIQQNIAYTTPVVTGIRAGVGINVSTASTGLATISNTALDAVYADASLVNLNGAVNVQDNGIIFIVFPGERQTALSMQYPVAYISQGAKAKAYVWAQHTGGSAQPDVSVRFIPNSTTAVSIPATGQQLKLNIPATDPDKLVRSVSQDYIQVTQPGYLCATITMAPGSTVKFLRQGFIVTTDTEA